MMMMMMMMMMVMMMVMVINDRDGSQLEQGRGYMQTYTRKKSSGCKQKLGTYSLDMISGVAIVALKNAPSTQSLLTWNI